MLSFLTHYLLTFFSLTFLFTVAFLFFFTARLPLCSFCYFLLFRYCYFLYFQVFHYGVITLLTLPICLFAAFCCVVFVTALLKCYLYIHLRTFTDLIPIFSFFVLSCLCLFSIPLPTLLIFPYLCLLAAFQCGGFPMPLCRSLLTSRDTDGQGKLNLEEFRLLWSDLTSWKVREAETGVLNASHHQISTESKHRFS